MNTANGYIDNNQLIDTMNSYNQQQYQLNQFSQINQLDYIDDYQPKYQTPYYNDNTNFNDDLQQLQVDDDSLQLKHWSNVIYECLEIQLLPENIAGGSDYGQHIFFIDSGDIILEIDNIKISGYTRNDVLNLIKKQKYHFIKAVSSSSSFGLTIDLKEFLTKRFARGSIDHELQSTIRDNVYIRTIPCTTRLPKPNEVDGVDYKFVTKAEFNAMDRSGLLLESGMFAGQYYGTPLPLSNPINCYSKCLPNEVDSDKLILNGKSTVETLTLNKSSSKELLNEASKSRQNNDQQPTQQLSAMALKRKRNRSNITAIDGNALPNGWEMIRDDHIHGVYFIDHINKRTQYERPYEVELIKRKNGFGFTLSYLQSGLVVVKTITPDGPASLSGVILPGDILVSVANVSVAGLNHQDIAKLFNTFGIDDRVKLTFARSLQLPNELLNLNIDNNEANETEYDLIQIDICKGINGFGFTISDSQVGQKVKKILDIKRCGEKLRQGDILASVNGIDLKNLNHIEVVEVLKNHCQIGDQTRFTVKRFKNQQNEQDQILKEDKESLSTCKTPIDDLTQKNNNSQSIYDLQNENLIEELKKNLALNNKNSEFNLNSPSSNVLINNYTNIDQTDLNNSTTNIYNVLDQNNQTNIMNSTMIMDSNQVINEDEFEYFRTYLTRNTTNFSFGFRIVGGIEEGRPVTIGSIVLGGVAHQDGILKAGDEIISINDQNVTNASHHFVVKLMSECGDSVSLLVRRRKDSDAFDVILTRDSNDTFGFGLIIISCGDCCLIGRIIESECSPAARCGRLKVRDKIVAVNNIDIKGMNHSDIVNMIKDSGLTLKLRIVPANCYTVELVKSQSGFGFSLRGGLEFNMPLFILRIAENGPACDLLNIGDEIIEINGIATVGMTHHQAVLLISSSGPQVKLKLRKKDTLTTTTSMTNFNSVLNNKSFTYYE